MAPDPLCSSYTAGLGTSTPRDDAMIATSQSAPDARSHPRLDRGLWARIDRAIGGTARYTGSLVLAGPDARPVVVVIVEQRALPDDDELRTRFALTPRESEVARLMADRLSNFEIARRLQISIHTVRRHSERVLAKLEVHSRNDVRAALTDSEHAPALRYAARSA